MVVADLAAVLVVAVVDLAAAVRREGGNDDILTLDQAPIHDELSSKKTFY